MSEPQGTEKQPDRPLYSKAPSYFELYANNVSFESNVWDLNVIFALLDQDPSAPPFKRIGSVHLPWAQAKLMAYYLFVNIAFQEAKDEERIDVPSSMVPAPFEEYAKEHLPQDDERTAKLVARIAQMRSALGL